MQVGTVDDDVQYLCSSAEEQHSRSGVGLCKTSKYFRCRALFSGPCGVKIICFIVGCDVLRSRVPRCSPGNDDNTSLVSLNCCVLRRGDWEVRERSGRLRWGWRRAVVRAARGTGGVRLR